MTSIMVVDDEPAIGEILTMVLTEKNYAVISFTSAEKALSHLAANPPMNFVQDNVAVRHGVYTECNECVPTATNQAVGLLLTDMQMPEMTGLELARRVKTLYPALPIICMSGSANGQDREEVFKLGADFIPKPFDLPELLLRINSLITLSDEQGNQLASWSSTCPRCGNHLRLLNRNYCFKCEKAILGGQPRPPVGQ